MSVVCTHCDHVNQVGALVCENCHQSLIKNTSVAVVNTDWLTDTRKLMTEEIEVAGPPAQPDAYEVILRVPGAPHPLVLELTEGGLILGRTDLEKRIFPDVDLSPFGAEDYGVSRRHARLTVNTSTREVEITDLGSLNGTYVNGARLDAHQSRFLNSGDEVHLSRLFFTFFYRS